MLCTSITSAVSPVLAVATDPPKAQIYCNFSFIILYVGSFFFSSHPFGFPEDIHDLSQGSLIVLLYRTAFSAPADPDKREPILLDRSSNQA
jgi:hypothetical protein